MKIPSINITVKKVKLDVASIEEYRRHHKQTRGCDFGINASENPLHKDWTGKEYAYLLYFEYGEEEEFDEVTQTLKDTNGSIDS